MNMEIPKGEAGNRMIYQNLMGNGDGWKVVNESMQEVSGKGGRVSKWTGVSQEE
jgi:hypothetical protein